MLAIVGLGGRFGRRRRLDGRGQRASGRGRGRCEIGSEMSVSFGASIVHGGQHTVGLAIVTVG